MSVRSASTLVMAACVAALGWSLPTATQATPQQQTIGISLPGGTVSRGRLVTITYDLAPPSTAKVEILSADGDAIRTLPTGAASARGTVVWDTRFDGPEPFDEPEPGPLAPPGAYLVRVTAGSERRVEVLNVGPAEGATPESAEDYAVQLALALKVRGLQTRANQGLREARRQQRVLRDTLKPGDEAGVTRLGDLGRFEDQLMGATQRRGQPPDAQSLSGRLAALAAGVAGLNGRPPDEMVARFEALDKEAKGILDSTAVSNRARPPDAAAVGAASATAASGPQAAIQFDSKGVDFGPWLRRFIAQMKTNWMIPMAVMNQKGSVVVTFSVLKDGTIRNITVVTSSTVEPFNRSALAAVTSLNPTYPLPPEYPTPDCFFAVTFYYNETPPIR